MIARGIFRPHHREVARIASIPSIKNVSPDKPNRPSIIKHLGRRLGVFGDLPTRLVHRVLPFTPWFLEPVLTRSWTFFFFCIARQQRQAVTHNLRALHPVWGKWRALWGAWRVFYNFARTYVDAMRCETGTGALDWEVVGLQAFEALAQPGPGRIVLTAHMGNYDIAAPVFSGRFGRTLFTVRAPEREAATREIRERRMRENEARHPNFRTLYNTGDAMLGIELARELRDGNLVAVQGDRVMFDVSPIDVEVEPGLVMRLPKGPLALARATGVECQPLFVTRTGWRRYRITVRPPLELPPRRRGEATDPAVHVWAAAVLDIVRPNWDQWFVFEKLLHRGNP